MKDEYFNVLIESKEIRKISKNYAIALNRNNREGSTQTGFIVRQYHINSKYSTC